MQAPFDVNTTHVRSARSSTDDVDRHLEEVGEPPNSSVLGARPGGFSVDEDKRLTMLILLPAAIRCYSAHTLHRCYIRPKSRKIFSVQQAAGIIPVPSNFSQ